MIIDAHMHLGDFLNDNGIRILKERTEMPDGFNIQKFEEKILRFNSNFITKAIFEKFDDYYTLSVINRIKAANLNNYKVHRNTLAKKSEQLFGDRQVICFCMPIAPYVPFRDVYKATKKIKSLRCFTSINPNLSIEDACEEFEQDAPLFYGLKLHPIIQGIPFNSERTFAILDIMKKIGKPVLFHAGASRYYLGNERYKQHCELDDIAAAEEMVKRYPEIQFVIGHGGIAEYQEWAEALRKYDNTYFDLTVQSKKTIRELISYYGEDKILFATDWPCVDDKTTISIASHALSSNQLEKCMFLNASRIYNVN